MTRRRWLGTLVTTLLLIGAILALIGGATAAIVMAASPDNAWLPRALPPFLALLAGFCGLGVLGLLASAIDALLRGPAPRHAAPAPARTKRIDKRPAPSRPLALPLLYEQVKTYIDLEIWELAYEKAQDIIEQFPESDEAKTLKRNLNELRWKAEPKYIEPSEGGITREEERALLEQGLNQMLEQIRTYMELEMWELARQKALSVIKSFPESPQSDEMARLFPEIEKKLRESPAAEPPKEEAPPQEETKPVEEEAAQREENPS